MLSVFIVQGSLIGMLGIAIEDGPIEEVYLLALDAAVRPVRLDIFPTRLDAAHLAALKRDQDPDRVKFWEQLARGYQSFSATHRPPTVKIDRKTGAYLWPGEG